MGHLGIAQRIGKCYLFTKLMFYAKEIQQGSIGRQFICCFRHMPNFRFAEKYICCGIVPVSELSLIWLFFISIGPQSG